MITVRSKRYQVHVVVFLSVCNLYPQFHQLTFLCFLSVFEISIIIKTIFSLCKHTKKKCFKVNRYEFSCSNCNAQISVYCCLKLTMVLIDYLFKLASEILKHEFFENIFIFNKECIIWCPSLSDSQYSKTYYLYHQSYHTPCKC